MVFTIGTVTLTDKAELQRFDKVGKEYTLEYTVYDTNAKDLEEQLIHQSRFADKVSRILSPYQEAKYQDLSPHGENLIYLNCDYATDWFLQTQLIPKWIGLNVRSVKQQLSRVDDLTGYRLIREAETVNVAGTAETDLDASNNSKVRIDISLGTTWTSGLDTEVLNLNSGSYSLTVKVYSTTALSEIKGTIGTAYGNAEITDFNQWMIITLGTFDVTASDDVKIDIRNQSQSPSIYLDYIEIEGV